MGKQGRPKNPTGWEFIIYAKIKQISKSRKLSEYKSWVQLTKHRNFEALMKPHFQSQKKYKGKSTWRHLLHDEDWIKNFYKNNIKRSQLIKRLDAIDFEYVKRGK